MERAKAGETAVRVSGGYRTFGRDALFRGKGMGMDDRFEDEFYSEDDGANRRVDEAGLYDDEPLDYDNDPTRQPASLGYHWQQAPQCAPSCCCCCCCKSHDRRQSRRSRAKSTSANNLSILNSLSQLTDGGLMDLAIHASAALAHGETDRRAEADVDPDFADRIRSFRERYRV